MKNAHERLGRLEFVKPSNDTLTRIRVHLDRLIVESAADGQPGKAHLISVFGNDQEIGAIWSAVLTGEAFTVEGPDVPAMTVSVGQDAQAFRGSISVPGRKRPLRHLVALSNELARPDASGDSARTILCDSDPAFVHFRLSRHFGLPVAPGWSTWFWGELKKRRAVQPLIGIGCSPVAVHGTKQTFMSWIGSALGRKVIQIPDTQGPIVWTARQMFPLP
jgi:hypothetical protein